VLQVSWNATHSVAQPEVKAARFLAKLVAANAASAATNGVVAFGAACSGKAACQFSGTGRVQALTISIPWRGALRRCVEFGARHRTLIMDGATAQASAFAIETRAIDVVAPFEVCDGSNALALSRSETQKADEVPPHASEVHQVVGERVTVNDDEWMYVLDKAEGTANDAVTAALRLAVDGKFGDAIAKLDGITDAAVREAPLVVRLRHNLDAQALAPEREFTGSTS
jgi:hypothetical protein